jgi:biopolymer transport protein ExbD
MAMNIGQSSSTSGELDVMLEMNTTPLIDVMLVLLVMLIITIPLNMHSVTLDVSSQSPDSSIKPKEPIVIEIKKGNQIIWNYRPVVDLAALEDLMKVEAQRAPDDQLEIHFKPEPDAKYEDVARVMAAAQRKGLQKIGIANTEVFAPKL